MKRIITSEHGLHRDNNSWYTTKTEVVQEPSDGHRRVIADVTYEDDPEGKQRIVNRKK